MRYLDKPLRFLRSGRKKIKRKNTQIAKNNKPFRIVLNAVRRSRSKLNYYVSFYHLPTNESLVLFEAFWGKNYADSPKALYEAMLNDSKYDSFSFVWAFRNVEEGSRLVAEQDPNNRTQFVKYKSNEYYHATATAKFFIRNARIPVNIIKKKDQLHIQTWHGTPLKRLAHDISVEGVSAKGSMKESRNKFDRDTKNYDFMISPSAFATSKLSSAFALEKLGKKDIIVEQGYPRNDFLINATPDQIAGIVKELNLPRNKKVVLYAPTWREGQHTIGLGYTYDLQLDFEKMKKQFSDEYVVLFRAHYHIANSFDFSKYDDFIINVSKYDDVNHLYVVSDILITDYSSVFFDYANLKRPILFFMHDLDHYKDVARGFYLDLKDLPGPIARTEYELYEYLSSLEEVSKQYADRYTAFNDRFNYLDDGHASQRVLERIGL